MRRSIAVAVAALVAALLVTPALSLKCWVTDGWQPDPYDWGLDFEPKIAAKGSRHPWATSYGRFSGGTVNPVIEATCPDGDFV